MKRAKLTGLPSAAKDCKALPSMAMSLEGLADLQTLQRPLRAGDHGLRFRGDLDEECLRPLVLAGLSTS